MNKLLAPNGKPSNLTPEQYKLVRTPAFKEWFGDWENDPENSSKVVDENGEPKVKWRGDDNPKNVFDYINYEGHGIYYFGDIGFAESFGDKLNSYFINSRNPFIPNKLTTKEKKEIEDLWKNDAEIILKEEMAGQGYGEGSIQDLHDYLENYYLWDKKTGWFLNKDVKMSYPDYNFSLEILLFVLQSGINFYLLERKEIIDWIKNNNYDGYESYEGNNDNIAVFNSNQIKLADGTNTTFDSNNPDIRFNEGGEINDFDKIKFLISISNINLVDYEYHIQYHSLYEELKKINNELGDWDSPKFNNEIEKYIKKRFFYEIKKRIILVDGKIRLFRSIMLKNINDLKTDSLGIYWAYNYDSASVYDDEGYQHTELNTGNFEEYIIQADCNIQDINWESTLNLYIINEFNEGEIRVKKNKVAHNLKIQKKGDKKWKFIDSNNTDIRFDEGGDADSLKVEFINDRVLINGNDIGLLEFTIKENELEIRRLYLNKENQRIGIGRKIVSELFNQNPDVNKIIVYPLGSSIPFWLRFTENVRNDDYFEITKNSLKKGMENYPLKNNNTNNRFYEGGSVNDKKQKLNKDMEYKNYAKGGKILGNVTPQGFNHQEQQKYARIGVTDKYQIQAYIDMGIQGVNFDSVSLAEKLKIEVQKLYDTYTDYLISEDSKGIDAFFLAQIRQAEINQEPTSVIDQIKENQQNPQKRLEKVNELAESQKYTLESWIYYFKDNLYPNEFIYLMFSAILKFNYNLIKKELISRTNKTTTNITSLSPSALAKLYTNSSNYLLKDYIEILAEEGQNLINEVVTIQADGGTWFTFLGKGNANDEEIKENAQKLTAFVQNTSWCTTSYAYNQLAGAGNYSGQGGNFYVFAEKTENGFKPEIAIRMNHEFVAEISGTLDGQNISPEYSEIAKRYCRLNVPNNSAEEYIDKLNYNIKVGDAIKRLENEGMYPTIMEDYLYVVKNKDGIGKGKYRENPVNQKFFDSVTTAINNLPNQYFEANEFSNSVSNLTPITKYFLGDLTLSQGNNYDLGTSSLTEILGNLKIENNSTSFGQLQKIGGDLIISSPTIQSFDSIELIGGQIIFAGENLGLTSFGNLTEYGGTINCITQFTNVIDLGNLVECGDLIIGENSALETTGNLSVAKSIQCSSSKNITFPNLVSVLENCDFNKSQTTDLPALQRVGGNFNINSSRVKIFPQLNFIGGTANFGNNFTTTTQNIERILGDLYLVNSRLKEFTNLTYVKGNIDLKGSLIESLGSIERTDGNIDLSEPNKLKSLGKLEFIGGYFNASGGDITDMGNVKQIIKFANFGSSKIQSLGNLESVGGSLFLKNSVVNNLGNLIFVGRKIEFGNLADLQAQWNQRTGQNENQNFAVGGAIESQKTGNNATLSISLLTRLLELSNEDLKNDLQIHKVVENVSSMSNKALTIDDYNSIIKDVNKFATGGQTEAQKEKVSNVMREFKEGKLKTSYGEKVTNPKQAIAIALSEAGIKRKEDGGVLEISAYEGNIPLSLPEHYYSADSDVELVPVVDLMKFREFDRKKTPKYNAENSNYIINNLKESFKNEGIKEPLIIEYSVDDNSVLLIEGNHRLNTAIDMGLIYLPARVVLRKNKFTPTSKKLSMQVDGMKPNEYGYIPSNLKPSQVGLSQAKKMFLEGGIIEGQLHSECNDETGCGVKFEVGEGGHIIEAERDEAVIVPEAFEINETMTITGTPSQIASALNVLGGGKNFDSGANIESKSFSGKTEQLKPMAKNTDVDYTIGNASIIINRRTMADTGIYKVTGTPKQIASAINSMNGNGVEIGEVGKLEKIK